MNLQHQKILVQNADNLRFILDLLCTITDERNSTRTRLAAADDIIDAEHYYPVLCTVREVFRSIANERTDKILNQGANHDQ